MSGKLEKFERKSLYTFVLISVIFAIVAFAVSFKAGVITYFSLLGFFLFVGVYFYDKQFPKENQF